MLFLNVQDDGEPWLGEECNKEGDIHNQFGVGDNGLEMIEPPPKVKRFKKHFFSNNHIIKQLINISDRKNIYSICNAC